MINKKIIGIFVCILFVGASVLPSISGNIEKKIDSTQNNEHKPSSSSTTDWWPMFHHDLQNSGYSTSDAPETSSVKWNFTTDLVTSSPAVADDKVYIGSWDDNVYCLNADTGDEIWSYTTDYFVDSSPAVADGKVYIGSDDDNVYCLNANTGSKIWSYTTGDRVRSSPAVADGKVYVGSWDNNVYCLNANTGSKIWSYTTGDRVRSSPAVVDGKVYIGSDDNNVYCLNANTGGESWIFTTGGDVYSSPAVADGKVYIGSCDDNVYCLNADTGSEIWSYTADASILTSPAVADGKVYIGSHDDNVYCLNADTGNKIWSYTTGNWVFSSPAVADGKVYFGSTDKNVYCLDADTGSKIWNYETWDWIMESSPAVADSKVYLGFDYKVFCFETVYLPTVTTNEATGVGDDHATLNGNLDYMGGGSSCEVWFVWDTDYHDNWQDYAHNTTHQTKSSTGPFSQYIDGLYPDTLYHYRAVASNVAGTSQGDDVPFETDEGPEPPQIDSITSYYADGDQYISDGYGLLLGGLDIENKYTVVVSGEVNYVIFEFGSHSSTDFNPPYEATFNTQNINPSDTLKVIAHHDTLPDDEKVCYPKIVQMPSWLSLFAEYTLTYDYTDYISFSISEKVVPGEGRYWTLKASVDFSEKWPGNEYQSPVYAYVPEGIPVADIGGIYGFSGGIGSSLNICTDGTIEVSGGFHAGVEVKSIKGNIGTILHGTIEFDIPNRVIEWTEMYININGAVTIPVFIIPLEICDIGIEVCVDITPHVGLTFNFEPTADPSEGIVPGLGIKIKDDNGIIGDIGCKVQAYAEEDFGSFVLYAEAGGDGTLYFQTPPNPTYFDDFILSCWIGAQLRIGFWTFEGWYTYDWIWSEQQRSSKEYDETGWQTLNTSYLQPDQGSYFNLPWSKTFYNGTLIENVFPYANPCISYNTTSSQEDEVMMVMAYHNDQNIGDPVQNMEILWCEWNENTGLVDISVIAKTRNDNRLQMDPQIAFDKNGNVVCVFVQTDTSINSNSDVMDAFNATEIAYCVYDKNSGVWSDINLITDNNIMDVSPVLASNPDGDILLVWTSDADNDHKTTDDRSIFASFWDGNSWSDTVSIVEDYSFKSGPAIAIYDDSEAICVFSRMIGNDEWVFYSRFQNGDWGNVLQFTDDFRYTETQPSAVYDADGTAYIIWLKNKYDEDDNGNLIYDGNLFYEAVGSSRGSVLITNGSIYDPVAIPSQSSSQTDIDFLVGWKSGHAANELYYTEIITDEKINKPNINLIYSSDKKLSEVSWCFMQDSVAVGTTERETLRNGGKNCNLSFIYQHLINNSAPDAPTITGPDNGKVGTPHTYTFTSTDPDGDDIAEYIVNWGDGPDETIVGPFPSGSPQLKSHTWTSQGTFTIKAKAIDIYGAESEWGELQVTMPRDKAIQTSLFLRFLQSHPNLFPILQKLIQQFGL